jgi:integrase
MTRRTKGRGTLTHQADGRWRARYPKGRTATGQTSYYVARFRTKAEADTWLDERRAKDLRRALAEDHHTALAAFLDTWLDSIRAEVAAGTWIEYRHNVERYIRKPLGHLKLHELARPLIRGWRADIARTAVGKPPRTIAPKTVQNIVRTLSAALGQAVDDGLIPDNPTIRSRRRTAGQARQRPATPETLAPEQIPTFLDAIAGHPYEQLYLVALLTGMRQGELLALTWGDVDFDRGLIHVRHALHRTPRALRPADQQSRVQARYFVKPGATKTESSRRTIRIPPVAITALQQLLDARRTATLTPLTPSADAYVFTRPASDRLGRERQHTTGQPLTPRHVTTELQRLLVGAGLPRLRFHDLRHTAATALHGQGVDLHTISRRLGHSRISTTSDLYMHTWEQADQAASDAMESLVTRRAIVDR